MLKNVSVVAVIVPAQANMAGMAAEAAAPVKSVAVPGLERHILPYRNGRDMNQTPRGVMVIDLFGLTEAEVRRCFSAVYQHIRQRVWPEREQNNRESYRRNWWIFGEPRGDARPARKGLHRLIATTETCKHRFLQFLPEGPRPDNMLACIARDDAYALGVLSSQIHVAWALAAGGWIGIGNDPH